MRSLCGCRGGGRWPWSLGAGTWSRWASPPLTPPGQSPGALGPPRPELSRVAGGASSQARPPPRPTLDGSGRRPCRRAFPSCLSSLTKGRCCVFKLRCPLFASSVCIYLFIYLLLVLKTKIASLLSALEAGGRMGGAVCAEAGSRGPWGACACVWGVEHVNPASVRCAVCCVCPEHVCMLRVACVLSGWVYKPASDPAGAPCPPTPYLLVLCHPAPAVVFAGSFSTAWTQWCRGWSWLRRPLP